MSGVAAIFQDGRCELSLWLNSIQCECNACYISMYVCGGRVGGGGCVCVGGGVSVYVCGGVSVCVCVSSITILPVYENSS